jgi:SPP1 gp7 family putative phage head morphogenesis protein
VQRKDTGHYVTVVGVGDGKVWTQDPMEDDGPTSEPEDAWLRRWWDDAKGHVYRRWMLAVGKGMSEGWLAPQTVRLLEESPVGPLQPDAALAFFRSLFPVLGTDPLRALPDWRRTAFILAGNIERDILTSVRDTIAARLASGDTTSGGVAVQAVLDAAGVTSANPQRGETIFRTEAMGAYNQGLHDQLQAEREFFPAWQYAAVTDNRARPWHAAKNGRLYASHVSFERVRGTTPNDTVNCRCTMIPIFKDDLAEMLAAGKRLEPVY